MEQLNQIYAGLVILGSCACLAGPTRVSMLLNSPPRWLCPVLLLPEMTQTWSGRRENETGCSSSRQSMDVERNIRHAECMSWWESVLAPRGGVKQEEFKEFCSKTLAAGGQQARALRALQG